jgi:hypothetical protein
VKRSLFALFALAFAACASLPFKTERRLAEGDLGFRIQKLAVLPLPLTFHACPDEIDRRARKDELVSQITQTALEQLKTRGYQVIPVVLDAAERDPKSAYQQDLGAALCAGSLRVLPASVAAFAEAAGAKAGANQVFLGGITRLRWHLKMDLGQDNGAGGEDVSKFEVRAAGAIYDLASRRVVWTENVEGELFTGSYRDAIDRVLLFSELKHRDPHEKLFYDLPPPESLPTHR